MSLTIARSLRSTLANGGNMSQYAVGIAPSLVLDFVTQTYAVDTGGWAEVYAVGGQRPSLVLDFVNQEYGA